MSTNTLQAVTESGTVSAAILDELVAFHPEWTPSPLPGTTEAVESPIVIAGTDPVPATRPVLVAVDDDGNAGVLLREASAMAEQLGVPLRAAYVWSDCGAPDCAHHRRCHRDLAEAGRLLTTLLDDHRVASSQPPIEREVLHADDPVEALVQLSAAACMLVVGSSSDRPVRGDVLGATTRRLLGRTVCPVVVVPHHRLSATRGAW